MQSAVVTEWVGETEYRKERQLRRKKGNEIWNI